jgi:hypothetical protein
MRYQQLTRRDLLKATALVVAGGSVSGCRGRQRDAAFEPHDAQTRQALEARDMGPAFDHTFVWKAVATGAKGPGARSRHGLVHDSAAKANVLFGGMLWSKDSPLADTWEFRDGQWSEIHVATSPPARHRGAMVYDSRRGQSVLFGGQTKQGGVWPILGDTWTYADRRWRQWRPGTGRQPEPRFGHVLALDEESGLTVLFGGAADVDRSLGDTWLLDGSSWRPVPGPAPPARRYAAFGFDPYLRGCVLNGGSDDEAGERGFGDTWLFSGGTWTRLTRDFDTVLHDDHALAYHRTAKRLIMFGGLGGTHGVRVREAGGWRAVEATALPPRHQCSPLAWNDELDGLVLHGGEAHHAGRQWDTTWVLRVARGDA